MLLFTTYYIDKNPNRQLELDFVLKKNIDNFFIKEIVLLCEQLPKTELPEKVKIIHVGKRLRFDELIVFANSHVIDGIKILSNSDIFFDQTLEKIEQKLDEKLVYCLTRWDLLEDGNLVFYENFKSQDAWVFSGKLIENIGNYYMGLPGCDNRFAKELMDSGYNIKNPSLTIKAIHVHKSNLRNYHKTADRVIGEYAYPLPTELKNHKTEWGQKKEDEVRLKYLHRKWRNDLEGVNYTLLERFLSRIISLYFKYLQN
jgi:hypothetical protein